MKNRIVEGYFDSEVYRLEQEGLLKEMTKDEWEDIKRDCDKIGATVYGRSLYLGDHDYFLDFTPDGNIVVEIDCDFVNEVIKDDYEYDVENGDINPDEISEDDFWEKNITNVLTFVSALLLYASKEPDLVQVYKIVD